MEEYKPTQEEIAKNHESRTLSDAELIKGGAHYIPTEQSDPRLEVTADQKNEAEKEMTSNLNAESRKKMEKEFNIEISKLNRKVFLVAKIISDRTGGKVSRISDKFVCVELDTNPRRQFNISWELPGGDPEKAYLTVKSLMYENLSLVNDQKFPTNLSEEQIAWDIPIR